MIILPLSSLSVERLGVRKWDQLKRRLMEYLTSTFLKEKNSFEDNKEFPTFPITFSSLIKSPVHNVVFKIKRYILQIENANWWENINISPLIVRSFCKILSKGRVTFEQFPNPLAKLFRESWFINSVTIFFHHLFRKILIVWFSLTTRSQSVKIWIFIDSSRESSLCFQGFWRELLSTKFKLIL